MKQIRGERVVVYQSQYIETYKGCIINKIQPNGFYESYIGGRFWKADTLQGIKDMIKEEALKQTDRQRKRMMFS